MDDADAIVIFCDGGGGHVARGHMDQLAGLMKRVWDLDVLICPRCSGRMRVIAMLMEREAIRAILEACGFPAASPPRSPPEPPPDESFSDVA